MSNSVSTDSTTDIAVIAMAGRFPGAGSVEAFWRNLRGGVESITFFSDEELAAAGVDAALRNNPHYVKARPAMDGVELFDAAFFGYSPREAEVMAPQHRIFLECAWEAIETAGYDTERYTGRVAVFAGVGMNSYLLNNLITHPDIVASGDVIPLVIANDKDFLATRVSYKLNLRGPSMAVQTACSTALVALHLACQSLMNGESDMALAGGVSITVPQISGYMSQPGGILSPDGHCRAFDADAQGTLFGNAAGLVVLKRLSDALADGDRIDAVIKGSAINNDGSLKVGYTAPSVDGQCEVIADALAMADVEPGTISYVEAHGTGTALGDPIEVAALTQVFQAATPKKGYCAIGSVKTNVGHLDTAAGIAGFIKAALALKHKLIPASLNFTTPNPQIDFANSPFFVNTALTPWPANGGPRRAGVNSFGMGGTNAHVILEEAPEIAESGPSRPWQLLVLSARTDSALEAATDNLAAFLRGASSDTDNLPPTPSFVRRGSQKDPSGLNEPTLESSLLVPLTKGDASLGEQGVPPSVPHPNPLLQKGEGAGNPFGIGKPLGNDLLVPLTKGDASLGEQGVLPLADVAYTLQVGRKSFNRQRILVCRDAADAAAALEARDPQRVLTFAKGAANPGVIFMFPGQGAQYVDMARGLYDTEAVFREQVDTCAELLIPHLEFDLRDVLYPAAEQADEATARLTQTAVTQPALFVISYALAKLWMDWGVAPTAMIGHSIGEYVAACLADVFTLEDALALVAARGRLMQDLPSGSMLSVPLNEAETRALLGSELSLAAVNGPSLCVVSGPTPAIEALHEKLTASDVAARLLHTSHAFHSAMFDPIIAAFTERVRSVTLSAPSLPYVSNLTGNLITAAEATDPNYWARHLREAVRFADGIATLSRTAGQVFLEVGPGNVLSTFARQSHGGVGGHIVLGSLRHPKDVKADEAVILAALGQLWSAGVSVDWDAFYADETRHRVALPTYPFERQRYWIEPIKGNVAAKPQHALGKKPDIADWFYVPSWKQSLPPHPFNPAAQTDEKFRWLLFDDECGLGAGIVKRLEEAVSTGGAHSAEEIPAGLVLTSPGSFANLQVQPIERVTPFTGEVEIEVHAAGVNFRDVLNALGLYPGGPAPLGLECSGRITRVGEGVTEYAVGDEVIAMALGCFNQYVTLPAAKVVPKPAHLTFEEAATIPVAFWTAYYALHHLGRIRSGERILIHAAAGGVGMAAVQLAQRAGAEIFATAGSPEKRAYLASLGITHVFDSRTLDFADEILRVTNGEGVDLVLNSLSGEFIPKSLALLAPCGRFLEIGKADIYANAPLGLEPFKKNLAFFAIDLALMAHEQGNFHRTLFLELMELFKDGSLKPLPWRGFPMADVESALLYMAQARQIGKIVLSMREPVTDIVRVTAGPRYEKRSAHAYTIDPARAEDYDLLIADLREADKLPTHVVHLWSAGQVSLADVQDRGFYSLLHLAQALGKNNVTSPVEINVVSSGLQSVTGEEALCPEKATLLGPSKVIPQEYPNITCRSIDVGWPQFRKSTPLNPPLEQGGGKIGLQEGGKISPERNLLSPSCSKEGLGEVPNGVLSGFPAPPPYEGGGWGEVNLVGQLIAELTETRSDLMVAYRGRNRWVKSYEAAPEIAATGGRSPHVRDNGVYLITGGTGGIGLVFAEQLAKDASSIKLALIGRSAFPARSEWDDWIAAHDSGDSISHRIQKIRRIEDFGAEVAVLSAEVSDAAQMREAVSQTISQFGALHGVIHSAGIPGGGVIQLKMREKAAAVLAPKLAGARALEAAIEGIPLDFFLLCSSTLGIIGGFGQVDYCGANAFLDQFAHDYQQRTGTWTVSINWDVWQEVGMAVSSALPHGVGEARIRSQARAMDHPLLDACVEDSPARQVYRITLDPAKQWILSEHKILGMPTVPGTAYLEMARAAFAGQADGKPITMTDVRFLSPLMLRDGETKEARLTFERREDGTHFSVASQSAAHGGKWHDQVRGKIAAIDVVTEPSHKLAEVLAWLGTPETVIAPEMPKGDQDPVFWGPRWHSVRKVHLTDAEGLALFELADPFVGDISEYALHPALLDVATSFMVLYTGKKTDYLPRGYKGITVLRPMPARFYSYMEVCGPQRVEPGTIAFDVFLMDESGAEIAVIEAFTLAPVDGSAAPAEESGEARYQPNSSHSELENDFNLRAAQPRPGTEGLLPGEGAETFRRILCGRAIPQIVVATQDLHAQIAQRDAFTMASIVSELAAEHTARPAHARPALGTPYVAPSNDLESGLADIWQTLLGIDQVGIHDSFFDLGGHSLLATQLASRVRQDYNVELSLASLFADPTVSGLAAAIRQGQGGGASGQIVAVDRGREQELLANLDNLSDEEIEALLAETGGGEVAE